ncbi:TIGR02391 family protein [Pseudanabaena sp. BC1403]|uniref:TIGR02391 family protein n=1 Tax=Pseudanabaena sp. BC1403 TaxID=2043171 RepID=UPI000CD81C08|nr:TIGR02391 family protein [Pseudanabaena sp. BC1403]
MYNLTDNQKKVAKWLVKNVKDENLNEEFRIQWAIIPTEGVYQFLILNYKGTEQELKDIGITKGSLNALATNKLLLYQTNRATHNSTSEDAYRLLIPETWYCTLTGNIYTAVDNDFNTPDTSFINYLNPLANPSDFDEALTKRCFPILATGGSDPKLWDSAVRTAGVILEERLRDVGNISDPNQTGQSLVSKVFGKNGTLESKFSVPSEQSGYRDLYAGIVGAFRNPSAHRLVDPSPDEGGAFIVFVNLLLKKLEDLR